MSKSTSKSQNSLYNKWRYTTRSGSFKTQVLVFLILAVGFVALRRRRQAQVQEMLEASSDYEEEKDCESEEECGIKIYESYGSDESETDVKKYEPEHENLKEQLRYLVKGYKKKFRQWYTGDNPGYRNLVCDAVPCTWVPFEEQKWSYDMTLKETIKNPDFVLHNRIPKTGSTTMHNIVGLLSRRNNFTYWKVMAGVLKTADADSLVQALQIRYKKPFFLQDMHYYFDFKPYDQKYGVPTWINIIREPVSWFRSHFAAQRYGPKTKIPNSGVEYVASDIQDCIDGEDKMCESNTWPYIEYFCGCDEMCSDFVRLDDREKQEMLDHAKKQVVNSFYQIGILEQFEDTLTLFEQSVPSVFAGALTAFQSDYIQFRRNSTRTIEGDPLLPETRDYLEKHTLKWEMDFYWFCRYLFNKKLKAYRIEPSRNVNT